MDLLMVAGNRGKALFTKLKVLFLYLVELLTPMIKRLNAEYILSDKEPEMTSKNGKMMRVFTEKAEFE